MLGVLVLKWQQELKSVSLSFNLPKQNQTVQFVTGFREMNKPIVRNLFPVTQISTVLKELEEFTYVTALYLHMGHYIIRLDPDSYTICTIMFPRGTYSYL